jgi:hypothetical protein
MSAISIALLFLPMLFAKTFHNSPYIPASVIWVLSGGCFVIAGYRVWRRERVALEAEKARHFGESISVRFVRW